MSVRWAEVVAGLGAAALGAAAAALAVGDASVDNACVESRTGATVAWVLIFLALALGIAAVVTAVWVAIRMRHARIAVGLCAAGATVGVVALIVDWAAVAATFDFCFEF
jgi:hypothetical protein